MERPSHILLLEFTGGRQENHTPNRKVPPPPATERCTYTHPSSYHPSSLGARCPTITAQGEPHLFSEAHRTGGRRYDKEDFNDVIKKLESLVDDNQDRFQKRVYDDIKRRINLLSKQFQDGKLSAPVQLKSGQLVAAIDKGDYDGADTIHVQLMVDHVSQVSQWLVGIKKLISLLRSESLYPLSVVLYLIKISSLSNFKVNYV